MVTVCSHTLVKNGMPFIGMVVEQVIPFVNRALITMSEKADAKTAYNVAKLKEAYPGKVQVDFENVKAPGELTQVRQDMVDKTTEDWILFLDDDDYWPKESMKEVMTHLDDDLDAMSFLPYQIMDKETHDLSWQKKWITRWFRNKNIQYRHPWPRDLAYMDGKPIYWKKNPRNHRMEGIRFLHLALVKEHSFRTEDWAAVYAWKGIKPTELPEEIKKEVNDIYERTARYK